MQAEKPETVKTVSKVKYDVIVRSGKSRNKRKSFRIDLSQLPCGFSFRGSRS